MGERRLKIKVIERWTEKQEGVEIDRM